MFAEVSLPISSFQTFTYLVPENLKKEAIVSVRVEVPFGNRKVSGIIVSLIHKSSFDGQLKSIIKIDPNTPTLSKELWKLVKWISHYYVTPIGLAYNTVLPFSLLKNYSPRQSWFAKFKEIGNISTLESLQKSSPKQFLVYNTIKKVSPNYLRVATLKDISSNPISICKALQNKGFIDLYKKSGEHAGDKIAFSSVKKNIVYNKEQIEVIDSIKSSLKLKKFSSNLLHGVTGSGKTEIFIESIKTVMEMGKSSIVLIPEISLTPQIAGRFKDVFGEGVALWHSQLTKAQRAKTWDSINAGESKIVIGARSAIFSPIKNLGLIIVDEEHDASYKQESPAPRYHARDVAIMRGKIESC